MKKNKTKQNKWGDITSHDVLDSWVLHLLQGSSVKKKKKKEQKKQRKSRRLIWVQAKITGCMYILLFVSVKTKKPNFCPAVIAASLINNLEAPSVQSHITSSSLSVGVKFCNTRSICPLWNVGYVIHPQLQESLQQSKRIKNYFRDKSKWSEKDTFYSKKIVMWNFLRGELK